MASTRDERLSKEEQEEEEMRNELTKAGVDDQNLSAKEMKELMEVLELSKSSSSQNMKTPITTLPMNNLKATENTSDTLEECLDRPVPSFSYKTNSVSGNFRMQSVISEKQINNKENSPESDPDTSYGQNLNNQTNSPCHELSSKNCKLNSVDNPNLATKGSLKTNLYDGSKSRPKNKKSMSQERWRLNPASIDEEDSSPLPIPQCPHLQREPLYSLEEPDSETFHKLYNEMSIKLDNLRERFIVDLSTEKSSLWGSPIKVGTSKQVPPYR